MPILWSLLWITLTPAMPALWQSFSLSGQLASVSTNGEPTVSYEFLSGYKGARRGSGRFLPQFGKGIPCEVAFSHSPVEAVAQAPSTFSFPLILYNIMASVRSGRRQCLVFERFRYSLLFTCFFPNLYYHRFWKDFRFLILPGGNLPLCPYIISFCFPSLL